MHLACGSKGVGQMFGKVTSGVTGARLRLSAVTVAAALAAAVAGLSQAAPSVAAPQAGAVVAWGYNAAGQATVPPAAQSGVIAIAGGVYHSLALKSDGSVIAWAFGYGDHLTQVSRAVTQP